MWKRDERLGIALVRTAPSQGGKQSSYTALFVFFQVWDYRLNAVSHSEFIYENHNPCLRDPTELPCLPPHKEASFMNQEEGSPQTRNHRVLTLDMQPLG